MAGPPAAVRDEIDVLLAVARVQTQADAPERLRAALRRELDWPRLLRLAGHHRLRMLLYSHLRRTAADLVPERILGDLHAQVVDVAQQTLARAGALIEILRLLAAHGITAVPYKGPALAEQLYGGLALREFTDLDLLVAPPDVWRAGELLDSLGYAPAVALKRAQRRAYMAAECDLVVVHRRSGLNVEIHWAITPPYFSFPLTAEHLLRRLEWRELQGIRVPALSPEDLLLVLCVNGSKEGWRRLEWVCGVAQLLRLRPRLDWPAILDQAHRLGARRILATGLRLAHELVGAPVAPDVLARVLADRAAAKLAGGVTRSLFAGATTPLTVWSAAGFRLRSRERWRDRMRYCVLRPITPTRRDLEWVALPRSLSWLYYLGRPLRLLTSLVR